MIITRTPYRISFFGGGTDYHTWYQEHGGEVLSTSINHYNYIHYNILPPFFDYKYKVIWKEIEETLKIEDIKHPVVREVLKKYDVNYGVEVHYHGDIPSRTGIGSSSSFTVGMIKTVMASFGKIIEKKELAKKAIEMERDILKENVGIQDQIAVAYGGFNNIKIDYSGDFSVEPFIIDNKKKLLLQNHLMLCFTGISRIASEVAKSKIANIASRQNELKTMQSMVGEAKDILSKGDILDFGKLLHESWLLKKSLSDKISSDFIDEIYEIAMRNGAIGGKVLGAGGGGFMLFFAKPEDHTRIKQALSEFLFIPFEFENSGSQIILYDGKKVDETLNF